MADYNFIKMYFDGKSTEDFNLWVVSDGSRYSTSLTPNFSSRTTTNPGRPGALYWGTDIEEKIIQVNLATDSITGEQLSELQIHFAPGKFGKLSFEETEYKYYVATINSPPVFNFIPFEKNGQHLYKGELSLEFLCPNPYALSDEYLATGHENKSWLAESRLPKITDFPASGGAIFLLGKEKKVVDGALKTDITNATTFYTYNSGTQDAKILLSFDKTYSLNSSSPPKIDWSDITFTGADGQSHKIIKSRMFLDVELTLDLVYSNSGNWEANKLRVMEQLKQDLDSPFRDTLLNIVANTGSGLTIANSAGVKTRITNTLFSGVVYSFQFNGIENTALLTTTGASKLDGSLNSTSQNYIENISSAFYGGPFIAKPGGAAPITTSIADMWTANQSLSNIKAIFQNTYI